ncbi:MAG: hypothetical protein J6Y23_00460 [Prevotella sp.]|nr:hypothetical protein [Prevotella sp.]
MKKTIYSLLTMALAVFALTSCEDVPSPFDFPTKGGEVPGATSEPAGSGTLADPYNVAAAIEYTQTLEPGTDSPSNVYIKGIISSIREEFTTQYGNGTFYISDDGSAKNQFLVYRAMYLNNKKFSASDQQIQVGDTVIICGIVTNYNGTLETQQNKAYIYSLNGAGGGGGGDTPTGEAKGSGTLDDPYNPAGAADAVKNLTWTSNDVYDTTGDVYVKGKISRIADNGTFTEGGTYGNASFYISEDGTENGEFYCFRILYLGNKKFESGKTDIKVGDEVIICGQLMNYRNNTPETVAGKAYLYSLNGKTEGGGGGGTGGDANGSGTLSDPYNPAGAADAVKNLTWTSNDNYDTTGDVYVKGKISRIADKGTFTEGGTYGNASFYISEDGTQNGEFYCYRILYLGNKKFESGNTDIKVGDEVIICGQLMNYRNNTPETVAGKAYLYSLNGKTEGGGGGGGNTGEVKAVTIAEFNAAAVSDNVWYQLSGTVKNLKDGDKYGNFDLEDATGSVYVYGLLSEKGGAKQQFQELAAVMDIKNGTKITIIGNRGDYQGKVEVLNAYLVSVDGQGGGGGGDPQGDAGSYSKPYSVTEAIAAGTGAGVYVKAYIVGCVSGKVYEEGATFSVLQDVKTNLLIAASASETDPSKCMPVQLPSGAVRNGLNLADNPDNLGKEVLLYGNIEAYFKVPGLKSVTYAEIGGKSFGTKANVRRKVVRRR